MPVNSRRQRQGLWLFPDSTQLPHTCASESGLAVWPHQNSTCGRPNSGSGGCYQTSLKAVATGLSKSAGHRWRWRMKRHFHIFMFLHLWPYFCTHTNMGTHLCTPTHTIQIYTCTQKHVCTHVHMPTHPNIMHVCGHIHVNTYIDTNKHAFCPFIYLVDMFLACLSSVGKNNLFQQMVIGQSDTYMQKWTVIHTYPCLIPYKWLTLIG